MEQEALKAYQNAIDAGMSEEEALELAAQVLDNAPPPEQPVVSDFTAGDATRMAAQGATLGFADELAGLSRILPGGMSPREAIAASRQRIGQLREQHPWKSAASEVAGGLVLGGAGAGASTLSKAPTLLRTLAQSPVRAGITSGVTQGIGEGEGFGGRLQSGAIGGVMGTVTGGAGHAWRAFRATPEQRAAQALKNAITTNPASLVQNANPNETIMDVGGTAVERLGRGVHTRGGEAGTQLEEFLQQRSAGAADRVRSAVQQRSGTAFEDVTASIDNLIAQQQQKAKPLYEAAFRAEVDADVLGDVMKFDDFKQAYEQGVELARLEGNPIATLAEMLERNTISVRALDYMKRGLDDVTKDVAGGVRGQRARVLRSRLNDVLERADELVPEYSLARATYAGDAAAIEAFENGISQFQTKSAGEIAKVFEGLSEADQVFFRRGAIESIRRKLAKAVDEGRNPDLTRLVIGGSEQRDKLRIILGSDEAMEAMLKQLRSESNMHRVAQRITGGSQTTPRAEDVARLGRLDVPQIPPITEWPTRMANAGARTVLGNRVDQTASALLPLLTGELRGQSGQTLLQALAASGKPNWAAYVQPALTGQAIQAWPGGR